MTLNWVFSYTKKPTLSFVSLMRLEEKTERYLHLQLKKCCGVVAEQRSLPARPCCPSEEHPGQTEWVVGFVGGWSGGRTLLTIWVVLLATLQQSGGEQTDGRRVRARWLDAWAETLPYGFSPNCEEQGRTARSTGRWTETTRGDSGTSVCLIVLKITELKFETQLSEIRGMVTC